MTREIELQARSMIRTSILKLIDRYLQDGVSVYDLKRFFNNPSNFKMFLGDIQYSGRRLFDDAGEYNAYVHKLLKDTVLDKISESEYHAMKENKVVKFNDFIIESVQFDNINIDLLFADLDYVEDKEGVAKAMNTRVNYVNVKNPKYSTYSVTDYTLDVSRNNRVAFDVMYLADYQLEKMRESAIKIISSGLYSQVPDDLTYMGITIKTHSVINKKEISEVIEGEVNIDQIVLLLSTLSGYKFEQKYGEHYIWKKLK